MRPKFKFKARVKHSGKSKYLKEVYVNEENDKHKKPIWSYDLKNN